MTTFRCIFRMLLIWLVVSICLIPPQAYSYTIEARLLSPYAMIFPIGGFIPEDISHAAAETFFNGNVPLLRDIPLERADDFAMADPEILKTSISAWEKEAEIKHRKAKEDKLQSLFEEYRSERRRGLV